MSSIPHAPSDLRTFWDNALAELQSFELGADTVPLQEPAPHASFEVSYASLGGVRVYARLALPLVPPGTRLPAIISCPGYGGTEQSVMLAESLRGYAILQIFPRGQGPSERYYSLEGQDKLTMGRESPASAYYRAAYLDVVRGVQYLLSRDDIDPARIGAMGTSQGGGLALAATALEPRIRCAVTHVPFLCALRHCATIPDSLVALLLEATEANDEATQRTLDYFDPLHLGPWIKAPTLLSAGGCDRTCPASSIELVYGQLGGKRSIAYYPELTHTSSPEFYRLAWQWMELYNPAF